MTIHMGRILATCGSFPGIPVSPGTSPFIIFWKFNKLIKKKTYTELYGTLHDITPLINRATKNIGESDEASGLQTLIRTVYIV